MKIKCTQKRVNSMSNKRYTVTFLTQFSIKYMQWLNIKSVLKYPPYRKDWICVKHNVTIWLDFIKCNSSLINRYLIIIISWHGCISNMKWLRARLSALTNKMLTNIIYILVSVWELHHYIYWITYIHTHSKIFMYEFWNPITCAGIYMFTLFIFH